MAKYCICKGPDDGSFMILCDRCENWFHGRCMGLAANKRKQLPEEWYCLTCSSKRRDDELMSLLNAQGVELNHLAAFSAKVEDQLHEALLREKEIFLKLISVKEDFLKNLDACRAERESLLRSFEESSTKLKELNHKSAEDRVGLSAALMAASQTADRFACGYSMEDSVHSDRVESIEMKVSEAPEAPEVDIAPKKTEVNQNFSIVNKKGQKRPGTPNKSKSVYIAQSQPTPVSHRCDDLDEDDLIFRRLKPILPKRKKLSLSKSQK